MSRQTGFRKRHLARRKALQVLYAWQVSQGSVSDIVSHILVEDHHQEIDTEYFYQIVEQVTKRIDEWDSLMKPHLSYPEIDPIELAILRMAVYELHDRMEVPYRVVINEALELAKVFGAVESHKFVNGVLDKVAREMRNKEER